MTSPRHTLVVKLVAMALGVIFIFAGVQKSGDLSSTRNAIQLGLGISAHPAQFLGYTLIFLEVALGVWLLSPIHRGLALAFAAAIFLAFFIWNASFLIRGIRADCGCGFTSSNPNIERGQWIATIRAAALMLVAAASLAAVVWSPFRTVTRKELAT